MIFVNTVQDTILSEIEPILDQLRKHERLKGNSAIFSAMFKTSITGSVSKQCFTTKLSEGTEREFAIVAEKNGVQQFMAPSNNGYSWGPEPIYMTPMSIQILLDNDFDHKKLGLFKAKKEKELNRRVNVALACRVYLGFDETDARFDPFLEWLVKEGIEKDPALLYQDDISDPKTVIQGACIERWYARWTLLNSTGSTPVFRYGGR